MIARAETVTILFTDLVRSTQLLQRAGDEQAQVIFKAHHRLLREAVDAHGGHEVKWLGDGLMVAFDSAHEAVKCAITMQQSSRRPTAGERLEIRVGLNVGEALVDESDYFGTPVVIARRLCDRAGAGQIYASEIVVRLLEGRGSDIDVKDLGALELKGIASAVAAVEIVYEQDPMALLRKLPFVGRRTEYEVLAKKLAQARNGSGSIVLLAGEPGIGKTRLAEEFCEHASPGATVIRGNCYEGDVASPFGPWLEALGSLIEQMPDDRLREALGEGASEIAAMLPELRRRGGDIEQAPRLDAEAARARLFDSIGVFFKNVARRRPLVIFLDDLHWCDKPSLALLEQIAHGIADRHIFILATYRDVEVSRVHPLAQTLASLRRLEHHQRIALRGFTQESVHDLLAAIEPSGGPTLHLQALAGALHHESEGNPFFIREVLNSLVETGALVQQDGAWVGAAASIEEIDIPEGIKEVIGRRLSRLSDGCNRMLQRASAITNAFTWAELQAICDEPEDELLDYLDEALGSQLLGEHGKLSYVFTHALIRATLYNELSGPRRVTLHRRVAGAFEALYVDDLDAHLGELAAHYLAAAGRDADKALEYSRRAGDRAKDLFAWEDAVAHYEHALDALSLRPAADERLRIDLLLALAEARLAAGGDDATRKENALRATDIARQIGDGPRFARAVLLFAGLHRQDGVLSPQLVTLIEEGLARVGQDDSGPRAMLLIRLSAALFFAGDSERQRRQALIHDALEMARALRDKEALAYVLRLAIWGWVPGTADEQVSNGHEMLALAREAGDKSMAMEAVSVLVGPLLELGNRDEADKAIDAYIELQREVRRPGWGLTWRAMQADLDGRLRDVESLARQGYTELQKLNPENAGAGLGIQLMGLRRAQGRQMEMEERTRSMADQFPAIPGFRASLCAMYAEAGRVDDARAPFETLAAAGFAGVPYDRNWTITMSLLADACTLLRDVQRAGVLYELLRPYQELCIVTTASCVAIAYGGSLHRQLGGLATTMSRWTDAERHYEAAMAMDERMRARGRVAQTQFSYGDMLLRRGGPRDSERARDMLSAALATTQACGMAQVAAQCERLLSSPRRSLRVP